MTFFIESLSTRNHALFIFGLINIGCALLFLILAQFSDTVVAGSNAWIKPVKFGLSIGIFAWTMGWYTAELHAPNAIRIYNLVTIVCLGFELIYIAFQAAKGELSHFNISTVFYARMTILMGVAAVIATFWTAYIGLLFFSGNVKPMPEYYLWSIRLGILLFVVFALEGGIMGARMTHTVGGTETNGGIPLLNWSTRLGDLRIAHFIGMHALQVIPLVTWYILKNRNGTVIFATLYLVLAIFTLYRALGGKPLYHKSVRQELSNQK